MHEKAGNYMYMYMYLKPLILYQFLIFTFE